jgi:hypothetical protein
LILVAQLACAPGAREIVAGFPPAQNARSAILITDTPGSPIVLCAEDLTSRAGSCSANLEPDNKPSEQVFVILLERSLVENALVPGPLALAAPGGGASLPLSSLGPVLGSLRADYDRADKIVSWTDATLPTEVLGLAVGLPPCPVLKSDRLWTVPGASVAYAAELSPSVALLRADTSTSISWFVVDSTGPHQLPGPVPSAFARGHGEDVWFAIEDVPYRGVVSTSKGVIGGVQLRQPIPGQCASTVVAAGTSTTIDVFWGECAGQMFHYDGTAFTALGAVPGFANRLIWGGPGEAFALTDDDPKSVYRLTTTTLEAEALDVRGRVFSVASIPGLGIVAGSDDGALYQRDASGQWSALGTDRLGYWVMSIAPLNGAAMLLLSSGTVGAYQNSRYCGQSFAFASVLGSGELVSLGSSLFLAAYDDTTMRFDTGFIGPSP